MGFIKGACCCNKQLLAVVSLEVNAQLAGFITLINKTSQMNINFGINFSYMIYSRGHSKIDFVTENKVDF